MNTQTDPTKKLRQALLLALTESSDYNELYARVMELAESGEARRWQDLPIAERLRRLNFRMNSTAVDLHDIGTDEAKEHAEELAAAANVVWQWSESV